MKLAGCIKLALVLANVMLGKPLVLSMALIYVEAAS